MRNPLGEAATLVATQWPGLFFREGFAPRADQFSASQMSTEEDCPRAWGYRYLWGLRRKEPVWGDPNLDSRDRSLAFGKALHARLEAFFRGESVDWTDEIGRRALPGLAYLPKEPPVWVEDPIGPDPDRCACGDLYIGGVCSAECGRVAPTAGLSSELFLHLDRPLYFIGYKDLVAPRVTYDHKSTGQVGGRYQKKPADLVSDLAANLYGYDDLDPLAPAEPRQMRWVYFQSRDEPRAMPVDFEITRDGAERVIRAAIIRASALRSQIVAGTQPDELLAKTQNCKKYGGCPYHHSAGGPCRAELGPTQHTTIIPAAQLLAGVTEPKGPTNMATLAERLKQAEALGPSGSTAPQTVPGPFSGFAPPAAAQVAPAPPAFVAGPPAGFAPPPQQFAPPPQAMPAAPQVGPTPTVAPFPPGAPAPAFVPPAPAQINPPEAAHAFPPPAPAPVAFAAPPPAPVATPAARRPPGRPRKGAGAALAVVSPEAPRDTQPAPSPLLAAPIWTVTHCLRSEDGIRLEVPAAPEVAEQVIGTVLRELGIA